jgi:Na+/proline symporter
MSAKNEDVAVKGSILGACMYLTFCMLPIFLASAAALIDPEMVKTQLGIDPQMVLPRLILDKTPLFAQIMFFGALLSAIMSTASGTLMAPSVTFTENVLKHFMPKMTDRQFIKAMRISIVVAAVSTTAFALYSDASIYEMVGNAYKVTLVAAVVPLFAGLFWQRATTQGALMAMLLGVATWIPLELTATDDAFWPPQLAGLLMSLLGMVLGTLLPQIIGDYRQAGARQPAAGHTQPQTQAG